MAPAPVAALDRRLGRERLGGQPVQPYGRERAVGHWSRPHHSGATGGRL